MTSQRKSRRRLLKGGNSDIGYCDGAVSLFTKGGKRRTKHRKNKGRSKRIKGGL